jgi:monofunctional biosynthetic peptidoglycan transglycosylase
MLSRWKGRGDASLPLFYGRIYFRRMKRAFGLIGAIAFWAVVISVLWVGLLRFIPPPVTWEMAAQAQERGGIARTWKPLSGTSSAMPLAVIAAEDQKFFDHFGFDMEAMEKAMKHNGRSKRVRGASTLTQQTAKNVFLWPGRTFLRKGLEAWFTVLMEVLWSKERVLEVYLNVAETGKGRFGVEAAAQQCFRRSALRISREQAALIAAVLPSPRRWNACRPSAFVQRRQEWILRQMRQLGDLMDPAERERLNGMRDRRERGHHR